MPRVYPKLFNAALFGLMAVAVSGCVYEPYPPPAPVAMAPPPAAYYGAPCCYSYYDYPPGYYYGPEVGVGVGYGRDRRYWR